MSKKSEQYESQESDEYDSSYDSEDEFNIKITEREGIKDLCLSKAEEKRNQLLTNIEESEEEEESESEDEDEDGVLAGKVADTFLDILPKIASRHPDIYKPDSKFFPDEIEDDEVKEKKEKALTYKDFVREDIVSKMEVEDEKSDSEEESPPPPPPPKKKSYDEELRDLKNEFLKAADGLVNDDEEEDDILNKKERTEGENEEFENEYKEFLKQQEIKAKDDETMKTLSQFWLKDDNLDENEKFLRDYIINKRWLIKDKDKDYVNLDIDDEDEEALNNQEDFESVYNFRYEEPDGDKIIQYARHQTDSLRLKSNKRKEARERKKERKRIENEKKKAEKIALKKEKKKEIWNKLKELVASEGLEDEALKGIDLNSDFDPQLFDQDLETLFGKNKKIAEEFEKYLEEYHQLDYEDIVGGMPVRFKYVKVKPCNYGLTPEQILTMDDKELNRIVSLKKLATYRDDDDKNFKKWKKKNKQNNNNDNSNKKKKKKRKRSEISESSNNNSE